MFKKVLIANRGEIASRVISACKALDIVTVAVYSEADAHAMFVEEADESYLIGAAQVNESYLNIDKILEVAQEANVDAIHPGYGFMSENSAFATKCKELGIVFIGPEPTILAQMGDKVRARKMMQEAGVPVVPGTDKGITSVDDAILSANEIGYPIMLKASAGGGGIGMQIVREEADLIKAFENNQKRAASFFGNGTMFLEKLLENVRHIEIQVLHDTLGNGVHLFERECSIQRRNQKVIEEAPSSFLSAEIRDKMGSLAVKAAKQIGYTNAGTVEFLVDDAGHFYFLEMNTRIQVEHAITEEITGIDIVKEQINIAQGKKLSFHQSDVNQSGWAMEARIYAEDPKTLFPSPGKIIAYKEPVGAGIRIESSVRNNTMVTPFYDPMISKLIVSARTREEAILRLKEALDQYEIEGIKTNIPMLVDIINDERFIAGNTKTNFLNK